MTDSSLTSTKTFIIHLCSNKSCVLKVSPPTPEVYQPYTPNSLASERTLLDHLSSKTDIPHPTVHAYDDTRTDLPYPYLLLSNPGGISLAKAKQTGHLTERQLLFLELKLGRELAKVHELVQMDWFGLPKQEKDEIYSWQEAFTGLLESLLEEVSDSFAASKSDGETLPLEEIRGYLSRAIGFFLFDDCEVPSLVAFLGDESTVFIDFNPENPTRDEDIKITSLVPTAHALWGDPLLETMFMNPSKAFLEGYGKKLVLFPRQRTKRIWYDLFLALVILVQVQRSQSEEYQGTRSEWRVEKERWARELLYKSVKALKNAPCY